MFFWSVRSSRSHFVRLSVSKKFVKSTQSSFFLCGLSKVSLKSVSGLFRLSQRSPQPHSSLLPKNNSSLFFLRHEEVWSKYLSSETQVPSPILFDWKMVQRCGIWQIKPLASQKQEPLSVKSNNSGFWTFWTLKLTIFETRFWTRDTCHVDSEDTTWKPWSSRCF